jgi:leucyl-tRNA synthetase
MSYSVETDRKWQKKWNEMGMYTYDMSDDEKKLYVLEMFSYPSGANLHIGHWYNYSLADSYARMKRMQGLHVFQPMGFDAFGLPAENYAIRTGIHPMDSTLSNIRTMEKQLYEMGGMFAWDHELATCEPAYYRWNQWLFLQLYKNGLAYRKNAPVNWCPDCQTVLANEQVVDDGHCERCHAEVTRKNLTQWFFKITDYAQELLDKLPELDWPEKTKKIQQNWIGRSEGSEIRFTALKDGEPLRSEDGTLLPLDVFTTRADTLAGVTYMVVAPESELCERLTTADQKAVMDEYIERTRKISDIDRMSHTREKTGVFTGSYAVSPLTGEQVPIWAADYVIAGYGTGVVMAVPAHDERDYEFAKTFDLPIRRVIEAADGQPDELPFCEYGRLVQSG